MSDDTVIVTDDRRPDWRARLVVDEHCGQPWGDAFAPALLVQRRRAAWASEVYQPTHADRILAAWYHFGTDTLFERYLRLAHVTGGDLTVVVFDTTDYRSHAGITDVCDLTGEYDQWRAWLDADVYGAIVEHHTADGCWTVHDSVWGLYGNTYAEHTATAMLTAAAAV